MGQNTRWLTTSQMCFFLLLSILFSSQLRLALCLRQTSSILARLEDILSLKLCTFLVSLTLGPLGEKADAGGGGKESGLKKRLAFSKPRRRRRTVTKKIIPSTSRLWATISICISINRSRFPGLISCCLAISLHQLKPDCGYSGTACQLSLTPTLMTFSKNTTLHFRVALSLITNLAVWLYLFANSNLTAAVLLS